MTPLRRAAVAPLLGLALAACAGPADLDRDGVPTVLDPSATFAPTTPAAPTAAATTPLTKPTPFPTLTTDLADGEKHYARLTKLDTARKTLTLDVVQFLTGEAAEQAAAEDDEEAFDYYVRNQNDRLRTLTYSGALTITVNTLAAAKTGSSSKDTKITLAELASYLKKGEAQQRVFWFTLKGSAMVALHEQYLP